MRLLIALLAIALLCCQCAAQVAERVDLPNLEGAYWSTFVNDGSPDAQRIASHLATDPRLRDLVRKTRFKPRPATDPFFVEKLRPAIGDAPVFVLQTPDGGIIYRVNGPDVPATGREMADQVVAHIAKWRSMDCPKTANLCPRPRPKPPTPPVKPIPDVIPDQVAPAAGFPPWLWAVVVCGGFVGGFGFHYLREHK